MMTLSESPRSDRSETTPIKVAKEKTVFIPGFMSVPERIEKHQISHARALLRSSELPAGTFVHRGWL